MFIYNCSVSLHLSLFFVGSVEIYWIIISECFKKLRKCLGKKVADIPCCFLCPDLEWEWSLTTPYFPVCYLDCCKNNMKNKQKGEDVSARKAIQGKSDHLCGIAWSLQPNTLPLLPCLADPVTFPISCCLPLSHSPQADFLSQDSLEKMQNLQLLVVSELVFRQSQSRYEQADPYSISLNFKIFAL